MNTSKKLLARLAAYSKERFPVITAFLYSLLFTLVVKKYLEKEISVVVIPDLIVLISMFLFLFRLRLLDEIKDFEYDSRFHPDRPIQRGILSKNEIKGFIIVILGIEVIIQTFNSLPGIAGYVLTLLYSLLIYKDFFAKKFFKKHLLLELIVHEPVFVIYGFYSLTTIQGKYFIPNSLRGLTFFIFILATPFIFELGRKMVHRTDAKGNITGDTYVYRWGEKVVFVAVVGVMFLQGISFSLLTPHILWKITFISLPFIIFILYLWLPRQIQASGKYWSLLYTMMLMITFSIT